MPVHGDERNDWSPGLRPVKLEFNAFCCRLCLEFRLGPKPVLRRHRIVPHEASVRRRLLRKVRRRLLGR